MPERARGPLGPLFIVLVVVVFPAAAPRSLRCTLLVVVALLGGTVARAQAAPDPASLVRPLSGTLRGGTFPGATTPFGMVQYSPNTDAALGGGYAYSHPRTWGFSVNHLSGPGCAAMGDVVSLPVTGPVRSVSTREQESTFSHASESASPGSYAVTLDASGARAELTATARTAWARWTFPAGQSGSVIVDPGADFRGARDVHVRVVGTNTIEGSVTTYGFWHACPDPGANRYTVFFSMRFDRPFTASGTGNGNRVRPGARSAGGAGAGAWATFAPTADDRPVVSKLGVSYTDLAGARRNLAAETGSSYDFDGVRTRARAAWDGLLGRIAISGGSTHDARTFYTALYHSLLHPNVLSDADGRYPGFDGRIHAAARGHAHYTNFSMWDSYRTAHPLIDLVAPEVVGDMVRSLLDDKGQSGWLPKWPYAAYETNEMVGDPAANVVGDALVKSLLIGGDAPRAYAALLRNATAVPSPGSPLEGRTGLADYLNRGFVPYGHSGDARFSSSLTLEYAVNDCAIARAAARLGHRADERYLLRRAKRFRGVTNPATASAQARGADASWLTPFDPASRFGFKEGSAAQYTWLVPQDVGGLAAALGGHDAALGRLDDFFAYAQVMQDPAHPGPAWQSATRFTPRNEDDLQAPYLYDYLGAPWQTQDMVAATRTFFGPGPAGLPGSDDLGALSAWYVLSALGLYPVTGGDDHYALTTPLFDHVQLTPPARYYPGGPIVIDAPGASAGLTHIRAVTLGGAPLPTSQLAHAALRHGAHLQFTLGAQPDPAWGTGTQTPASACAADPPTPDVRLRLSSHRGSIRTTLHNAGDATADHLAVHLVLPAGWSARATGRPPAQLASGGSASLVWRLRAPAGDAQGTAQATATWGDASGPSAAMRTFATATARGR